MAGPGGKEIGRLTVRVLPDTDGFREAVKKELEGYGDIQIGLNLDPEGFRQQVAAAVKAAEAGQEVDVPVDIDSRGVADDLAKALKVAPADFQIQIDKDRLKADFREAQNDVQVTPELDMGAFQRRMRELLKPVELPIEADLADQSIKRELARIDELGKLEIPMEVDTSGFTKEALQARADAAKILEKNQIRIKLDAQDDELRQKLARARAELKELNELGVSPKYDGNAIRQAQTDLQRYLTKLEELQKKKTYSQDQEAEFAKLKIDLEHAWNGYNRLQNKMRQIGNNPAIDKQSQYAEDLAKQTSDAFFKAQRLEKKLRDIDSSKIDPKIDFDIADLFRKIDTAEGRINDMKALGGSIQFQADVDKAIADIRRLESESARASAQKAKIEFEVDTSSLENARQIMRETSENGVRLLSKSFAEAKTQVLDFSNSLGPTGTKIMQFGNDLGPTGTKFLQFGDDADNAGRKMSIFRSVLSGMGGVLSGIGQSAVSSGVAFTRLARSGLSSVAAMSALASVAGVAGAAITAAFGAVATAIAAVNPAIALLGLSFSTIYLGIDGIKKAAQQLGPEINRLKANLSATFENRLTPVFAKLKVLFQDVLKGSQDIAIRMSQVADSIADVLVNAQKMGVIADIFQNVEDAIQDMGPGIESVVQSMLKIMQLESGFKALTGAVDAFGAAFEQSVRKTLADGSLDRAFSGLEKVLRSLSRAFVGLVENGLKAFAGAAPGVSSFIESLTEFFGRFNWERLGRSVGNVFDGLGDVFTNVPDSTIEGITQAFEDLGEVFQNPEFQKGLGAVIDNMPEIITFITTLTLFFSQLARAVANVVGWIVRAVTGITNFGNTLNRWVQGLNLPPWLSAMLDGMLGTGGPDLPTSEAGLGGGGNPFASWGLPKGITDFFGGSNSFTAVLDTVAFDQALTNLINRWNVAMDGLGVKATTALAGVTTTFTTFYTGLIAATQQQLAMIGFLFLTALTNMQLNSGVYLTGVLLSFKTAFQSIVTLVQTQMALVRAAYLAGLVALRVNTTIHLQGIRLAFFTAFVGLAALVTQQMALVQFAYMSALTQMQLYTGIYLLGIQLSFTTMFAQLATIVTTQMALVQFAFLNALLQMQLNAGVSLTGIIVAFRTAFGQLATVVTTQMALVQFAFLAAMLAMQTQAGVSLTGIIVAFQTASAQILAIVQQTAFMIPVLFAAGLAAGAAAVVAGLAAIVSITVSSMANFQQAIRNGMLQAVQAIVNFVSQSNARFAAWASLVLSVAASAMSGLVSAISSGLATALSAVSGFVSSAISTLDRLVSGFSSAGSNAVRALGDAIRAGASAVISAASWVATQAINAANWALGISSPSREFRAIGGFMMAGWSRGVEKGGSGLVDTVKKFTGTLIDEAYKASAAFSTDPFEFDFDTDGISNAVTSVKSLADTELNGTIRSEGFGDIGERVENALSGWSVDIDGDGMAKLVNKSNTRKARRR